MIFLSTHKNPLHFENVLTSTEGMYHCAIELPAAARLSRLSGGRRVGWSFLDIVREWTVLRHMRDILCAACELYSSRHKLNFITI